MKKMKTLLVLLVLFIAVDANAQCNVDLTFTQTNIACFGESTGAATATVTIPGGSTAVPPFSYSWSNGDTTSAITNLFAGTYTVTVSDGNGCQSGMGNITVNEPVNPLSINMVVLNPTVVGECVDGEVTAVVNGGTPPYSYLWSNGDTTNVSENLGIPGSTYFADVTVTDANGCTFQQQGLVQCIYTCTQEIHIDNVDYVSCKGDSTGNATVSFSSFPVSDSSTSIISWIHMGVVIQSDTGNFTSTLSGVLAGVYVVEAFTDNEVYCPRVQEIVTISEPNTAVSANAITLSNPLTLFGSEGAVAVNPSGGTPPYTYLWNDPNNSTTQFVNGLNPGIYCVTVTDANGCEAPMVCTIIAQYTCVSFPTVGFNANNVSCNGLSDGEIVSNVTGGNQPYTYDWLHLPGTNDPPNLTGLPAGTYELVVTAADGCSSGGNSVIITQPSALTGGISVSNVLCAGDSTGSLNLTVSGGTPPYTYNWNNLQGNSNPEDQNNLPAGVYSVVLADVNGCTVTVFATISEPSSPLTLSLDITPATQANGCANGMANALVSGGMPPYTYLWSNGQTTDTIINIIGSVVGEEYFLTVTDANGCQVLDSATVFCQTDCDATLNFIPTHPFCDGDEGMLDGVANSVNYIDSFFTFEWSKNGVPIVTEAGVHISLIANLTPGWYVCSVTIDGLTCPAVVDSFELVAPSPLVSTITTVDANLASGCNDGSAIANVSGGTPPYTYNWNNGSGASSSVTGLLGSNLGVDHNLVVTDANGCIVNDTATIFCQDDCDAIISLNTAQPLCYGDSGTITATSSSANFPAATFTYEWTKEGVVVQVDAAVASSTINNASPGWYVASATIDGATCLTVIDSVEIVAPDSLILTETITDVSCFGFSDGAVSVSVSGGTSPYVYDWAILMGLNNPPALSSMPAGDRFFTVFDANNCMAQAVYTIDGPDEITFQITPIDATSCSPCNGEVILENGSLIPNSSYEVNYLAGGIAQTYGQLNSDGNGSISIDGVCPQQSNLVPSIQLIDTSGCGSTYIPPTVWVEYAGPMVDAVDDYAIGYANVPLLISMGNNDTYTTGWYNEIWPYATHGTQVIFVDTLIYTPDPNFTGLDTTTYELIGECGNADTAIVILEIVDSLFVWPGDANSDGIANNFDVLEVGLHYNASGYARDIVSTAWAASLVFPWDTLQASGANVAHVDCDGLGVVDSADIDVISLNYNLMHPKGPASQGGGVPVQAILDEDSIMAGDTVVMEVKLGTPLIPGNMLYGIAYTINFDNTIISDKQFDFDFSNSWLTPNGNRLELVKVFHNQGKIDVGQSRLNGTEISGNGTIASIGIIIEDDLNGKDFLEFSSTLTITDVRLIDLEEDVPFDALSNTFKAYQNATSLQNPTEDTFTPIIYPNPTSGLITIEFGKNDAFRIELLDITGSVLSTSSIYGEKETIDLNNVSSGIYFVRLSNGSSHHITKVIKE